MNPLGKGFYTKDLFHVVYTEKEDFAHYEIFFSLRAETRDLCHIWFIGGSNSVRYIGLIVGPRTTETPMNE